MMLQNALSICVRVHKEIDRDGLPHSFHCLRVALRQESEQRMCIGLLHDLVEDHPAEWTFQRVEKEVGPLVTYGVYLLTKPKSMAPEHYTMRLLGDMPNQYLETVSPTERARLLSVHEDAMHVRMDDIHDNTSPRRLDEQMRKKLPAYHEEYALIARHLGYTDKVLPIC